MSNLMASLSTAGGALDVYQQALGVVQNNITNSTTSGFATQALNLEAMPFDTVGGLAGGVAARGLDSARDEFAEEEVRRQLQKLGYAEGGVAGATAVENLFNISGTSGVPADLDRLLQSFSAWSVSPASADARQQVISSAGQLTSDVRDLATRVSQTAVDVQTKIGATVDQINQLASAVQAYNIQHLQETTPDPNADANVHSALEQLSELVDFTTVTQADGTITVVLSGGAPLVIGQKQYAASSTETAAGNGTAARILDSNGNDITGQVTGGKLGGLLDIANQLIPSLIGGSAGPGSLNLFAQGLADTVNGILESGYQAPGDSSGTPDGVPLFTYSPQSAASTFSLAPSISPETLAPVDGSGNANGNALKLASLADSTEAGGVGGQTFGDYFSGIAAAVGAASASAQSSQQSQQQIVAQARAQRDQISGVSLDQQAMLLMQFERSYQAAARLITTINDIAGDLMNLIP